MGTGGKGGTEMPRMPPRSSTWIGREREGSGENMIEMEVNGNVSLDGRGVGVWYCVDREFTAGPSY